MFIVFSFSNKNFLTKSNILLLLEQSAPLLIGVIGITFVLMDGGTDISAGSNMYLSAAVGALLIQKMTADGSLIDTVWEYLLIMLVATAVGILIGIFNGVLISRFKLVPFIVTLITTSMARGLGMFFTDAKLIIVNTLGFKFNDKHYFGISLLVFIALALIVIFHCIMRYTTYGCQLKAQGNNHEAAQKLGIMGSILKAHDRMRHPERCVLYVSTELYTALKIYLMDKTNSYVTRETIEGGIPVLRVDGMKAVRLDCMVNNESQFV
jgi:ribose/xylose/arabinose/galactoside ABC-type transport system permease subunit